MTPSTIPEVIQDAEELYNALTEDLVLPPDPPPLELNTEFDVPDFGPWPEIPETLPMTVEQLTTGEVGGSGVFDKMMAAADAHLCAQHKANRITGGDYAKVYLGAIQTTMQQAIVFLSSKDKVYIENMQMQANLRLTQLATVKAQGEVELIKAQIQTAHYVMLKAQMDAYTARNQYALSKMALVTGYNGILTSEAQVELIGEQVETQRAQTRETNSDGDPIEGILGWEKKVKEAQSKLVNEQYESQRGQSRDTNSEGGAIVGLIGAQRDLYQKQIWAYSRDGEAKFLKMIIDTWVARKTIDEGVAVPDEIDVDRIDELVLQSRLELGFDPPVGP